jgi:GT2 family glycosyltransferase
VFGIAMGIEPTLTVSIVNTNNRDLLRGCLGSIQKATTRTSYEIIVVDNDSDDGSAEMVQREFSGVRVIKNKSRQGYGHSHNRAILDAKGEYILIFNEDMIVLENALDAMVEKLQADRTIGALGCRLLNQDLTLQHSCFRFRSFSQDLFENIFPRNVLFPNSCRRGKMYYWDHDEERDVDIIMGCCMMIPRKIFAEVGLFDPMFFVYSEEDDLCKRIKNHGYRVVFTPDAEIVHIGGQTSKEMSLRMSLVMMESKIRYTRKHHGAGAAVAFKLVVGLGAILRIYGWLLYGLAGLSRRGMVRPMVMKYLKGLGLTVGASKP